MGLALTRSDAVDGTISGVTEVDRPQGPKEGDRVMTSGVSGALSSLWNTSNDQDQDDTCVRWGLVSGASKVCLLCFIIIFINTEQERTNSWLFLLSIFGPDLFWFGKIFHRTLLGQGNKILSPPRYFSSSSIFG